MREFGHLKGFKGWIRGIGLVHKIQRADVKGYRKKYGANRWEKRA